MFDKRANKFLCVVVLTVLLFGCDRNSIANLTNTLGNAVAMLAEKMGNTEAAARLRADTQTAVAAIQNWKEGTSPAEAIRAINRVIDDLQSIPGLDKFRPLITLALGTAAAIIEALNRSQPGGEQPHTPVRLTQPPTNAEQFRHTWDAIRAGSPDMQLAPVL